MYTNINKIVHQWLDQVCQDHHVVIDATCGQGHDTYKLALIASKVYAFDIQAEAIQATKKRCIQCQNIEYFHDSHDQLDYYIKTPIDGAIFNLGYLPHSDKKIMTQPKSTLCALDKIYALLKEQGWLIITCYRGHKGGEEEYKQVEKWVKEHFSLIEQYTYQDVNKAPVAFLIKKTASGS